MIQPSYKHREWNLVSPISILFFLGKHIPKLANLIFQQSHLLLVAISLSVALSIHLKFYWLWVAILGAFVGVLVLLLLLAALLTFLRFRFKVSTEHISVREGVFRTVQTDVPWSRVRAINIRRNVLERITKLATISIDTAGTAQAEILIPALRREFASSLRNKTGGTSEDMAERAIAISAPVSIYRMSVKDLILASLCSSGAAFIVIFSSVIVLVFLFSGLLAGLNFDPTFQPEFNLVSFLSLGLARVFEQFQSSYLAVIQWIEESIGVATTESWVSKLLITVGLLAIAVLMIYVGTFLFCFASNFNLHLQRFEKNLTISRGLFTTRYTSLSPSKIQMLSLRINFREILFGIGELTAKQSASGRDHRLVIPSSPAHVRHNVTNIAFGSSDSPLKLEPRANAFIRISPIYLLQLLLNHAVAMSVGVAFTVFVLLFSSNSLFPVMWWLLWVPCSLIIASVCWRKAGYAHDSETLISKRGLLGYRLTMGKIGKVQRISIKQNAIQRFTGKSTLMCHYATGHITIPYMRFASARLLSDYVLSVVESKEEHWQ